VFLGRIFGIFDIYIGQKFILKGYIGCIKAQPLYMGFLISFLKEEFILL
jgi:hypothetical protein